MKNLVRGLSLSTLSHVYTKEIEGVVIKTIKNASKDKSVYVRRVASLCTYKVTLFFVLFRDLFFYFLSKLVVFSV